MTYEYCCSLRNIAAAGRALLPAALLLAGAGGAMAGQCPAGREGVDVTPAGTAPASRVTDTVLTTLDVAREPIALAGRQFRLRRLVIQPGGVVPWHSHADRPAIIHVVRGTVTEYASTCAVPIVHKAGETTPERSATSHWWKNNGRQPVELLSADLFPVAGDAKMM